MIISRIDNLYRRQAIRMLFLSSAMFWLLPCIVRAQNFAAVEKRLAKAVLKEELSLEQAAAMMETLRDMSEHEAGEEHFDIHEWLEVRPEQVGDDLTEAVKAGKISEAEAWEEWRLFKSREIAPRLEDAVHSGQMSKQEVHEVMRQIQLAETGARIKAAVARGDISAEEAREKWEQVKKGSGQKHPEGIRSHFREMGIEGEAFERIVAALKQHEFSEEQIKLSLGVILRMSHAMKTNDKEFQLDPRLRQHLKERADLSDEQIESIVRIARRITHAQAHGKPRRDDPRSEPGVHWESIKRRIEAAVQRGDLTREEADAKHREIRAKGNKARQRR